MQKFGILLLAVCFFTVDGWRLFDSKEEKEPNTDCVKRDVDEYVDEMLDKVREEVPDPIRLPPKSKMGIEFHEGVVWGLSTIFRSGNATIQCHDNNTVSITIKFGAEEIKGRYTWTRERRSKDWEGYVVFISDDFEAEAQFKLHLDHEDSSEEEGEEHNHYPELEHFVIQKFKDVRVEITGLGVFTWALSELTTMMSGILQRAIAHAVQGPLREALEREMREMKLS